MVLQQCNVCLEELELNSLNFLWRKDTNNYRRTCRSCGIERSRKYREDNLEKVREYDRNRDRVAHKYGISKKEYDVCMDTSISCEQCGSTEKLCYDHDHDLKGIQNFRGVLCLTCNLQTVSTEKQWIKQKEYMDRYYKARKEST